MVYYRLAIFFLGTAALAIGGARPGSSYQVRGPFKFELDSTVSPAHGKQIKRAMHAWSARLNIDFVQVPSADKKGDRVRFLFARNDHHDGFPFGLWSDDNSDEAGIAHVLNDRFGKEVHFNATISFDVGENRPGLCGIALEAIGRLLHYRDVSYVTFVTSACSPEPDSEDLDSKLFLRSFSEAVIPFRFDGTVSEEHRAIIVAAMHTWMEHLAVEFRVVEDKSPAVEIAFLDRGHDDGLGIFGDEFNGVVPFPEVKDRVPAHVIRGSAIHFRRDLTDNLYTIALHELGHVLGLSHSQNPESVMFAYSSERAKVIFESELLGAHVLGSLGPKKINLVSAFGSASVASSSRYVHFTRSSCRNLAGPGALD